MTHAKVYVDTSVAVEYVLATGREPEEPAPSIPASAYDEQYRDFWEALLKTDRRINLAARMRSAIGWGETHVETVISPFVLLELDEWYAAEVFRANAVEYTHVKAIQQIHQKRIGDLIKIVYQRAGSEHETEKSRPASALWDAISSGPRGEALAGILIEGIDTLKMDEQNFGKVSKLALFQMGLADIVHLLAADSMKCTHFATLDSDYHRLQKEIESEFEFKVLYKNDIISTLTSG